MKLRVTMLGGEFNEEGSDDRAFRIAANDAFEKGLTEGGKVLLEPVIMKLRHRSLPDAYLRRHRRRSPFQQLARGLVTKTEHRSESTSIEAHAPLKGLFGYSNAIRSLSQGHARVIPWNRWNSKRPHPP